MALLRLVLEEHDDIAEVLIAFEAIVDAVKLAEYLVQRLFKLLGLLQRVKAHLLVETRKTGLQLALQLEEGLIDQIIHHRLGRQDPLLYESIKRVDFPQQIHLHPSKHTLRALFCSRE